MATTSKNSKTKKSDKTLLIVESPSKAKVISKYLGSKYKVIASVGHVRDLPKSRLAIDVANNFEQSISILVATVTRLRNLSQRLQMLRTFCLQLTLTVREKLFHGTLLIF